MSERLLALASGVHDGNPPEISPADMVRVASDAGYNSVGLWIAPGEGSIPVAAMTRALPADLPISLEIRSLDYRERYPDPVERARVILERTRAFFADMYADTDND